MSASAWISLDAATTPRSGLLDGVAGQQHDKTVAQNLGMYTVQYEGQGSGKAAGLVKRAALHGADESCRAVQDGAGCGGGTGFGVEAEHGFRAGAADH